MPINTTPLKSFAAESRNILKQGVLNRILTLGFDIKGNVTVEEPKKIQGATLFANQMLDEGFCDAWKDLKFRIASHGIRQVCEEAAYTWFNRLVAVRIMQKNGFIEPVMEYTDAESRMPVIVAQARAGLLTLPLTAGDREKLDNLLADPTQVDAQFALLIEAFCEANPVIYNCFGGIDKYVSLLLPDNILVKGGFIDLLNNTTYLTDEDYAQSELIGWLYQFYISEKKDEVFSGFKNGKKAEAEDIPAATQIFTPNWIVKYMVQNTLGRTYLDNNPDSPLADRMKYLVRTDEPTPEDAILRIDDITKYTMVDPASGSGHILNEGFDLLYDMYMEEFYSPRAAIENIFRKNLIGIDIDTRAKQLATFSLLMKAARKDRSFLDCKVMPRVLDMPEPFVYPCEPGEFFGRYLPGADKRQTDECTEAFELLKQASNLGSIMKFNISDDTRHAIEKYTAEWESREFVPEDIRAAIPSMRLILALTDRYVAVCANPPYMGAGNMNPQLSQYIKTHFPLTKNDLGTVFMDVSEQLLEVKGSWGMINQSSWANKSSYSEYRAKLKDTITINTYLDLGSGTFDEISGEVVQSLCFSISKWSTNIKGRFINLSSGCNSHAKELMFFDSLHNSYNFSIKDIEVIPDLKICYWISHNAVKAFTEGKAISLSFPVKKGLATGSDKQFLRLWHEIDNTKISYACIDCEKESKKWITLCKGGGYRKWYGNIEHIIDWENNGIRIKNFKDSEGTLLSRPQNIAYMLKEAISYNIISSRDKGFVGRYLPPHLMMTDVAPNIYNSNIYHLLPLLNSVVGKYLCNILCPSYKYETGYVGQIPIIRYDGSIISDICKKCIELSKRDWTAHETSWDFKQNELIRLKSNCGGNVANLDMLSPEEAKEITSRYDVPIHGNLISDCHKAYKREWERNFYRLHSNEVELNRKFIEIYGLQDELTPDVPLNEITILQQGEISIADNAIVWHDDVIIKQFISYAIGCWMGRYRLDREGLNIAYHPKEEEICSYEVNGFKFEIDDDGIIPLISHQNPFEDDNAIQKIVNFVKMVFGTENLTENLNFIEQCLGMSIEDYLMKDFWKDHKRMYQNRPIYWLFSSKKGAFQALVYMHRMNPYTAEKVRTKYLLPYIEYLQARIRQDTDRGAELTTVERRNLSKMEAALSECQEYHDRLHDVAGRNTVFDLDDGVVVNYAKFGDVLARIK